MDITPVQEKGILRIEGYGVDGVLIDGTHYTSPISLLPTEIHTLTDNVNLEDETAYQPFIEDATCSIVLIGTGKTHQFISAAFRKHMKAAHNLTIDVMDTGAACRTYNVLVAESRPVGALLMPVMAVT